MYTTKQWEWDEAKFQMKTPLRELSESIGARIGGLDEELKMKVLEVNNLKSTLQVNACLFLPIASARAPRPACCSKLLSQSAVSTCPCRTVTGI